jgi:4-hydroxy-tetrahydrodipicolinate synthase
MSTFAIDGIVPVIPTPFTADDRVDWAALHNLLDFAAQGGVCAVCLPAYASEFYKLTDAERSALVDSKIVELAASRSLEQ